MIYYKVVARNGFKLLSALITNNKARVTYKKGKWVESKLRKQGCGLYVFTTPLAAIRWMEDAPELLPYWELWECEAEEEVPPIMCLDWMTVKYFPLGWEKELAPIVPSDDVKVFMRVKLIRRLGEVSIWDRLANWLEQPWRKKNVTA